MSSRGYARRSFTPDGMDGMLFTARYGYVGLSVEREEFVAEGLNEEGLSAGLFYFPGYGEYEAYDPARKEESIADLQLVSLVLGACRFRRRFGTSGSAGDRGPPCGVL